MLKNLRLYVAGTVLALATALTLSVFNQPSSAAGVDTTRDCDETAIIHCGVMTLSELKTKYAANEPGDLPAVYKAFGVTNFDGFVDGVVWRDGTVTIGDKVVATGAMTAARNMSGGDIAGSNASVINPNVWPAEFITGKPAYIKMVNGSFAYAVLKTCGNPVKANPTPKPASACKAVTVATISRTEYEFTGSATVANGATVSGYVFTVKNGTGAVVKTVTVNTAALTAKSGKVTLTTAGNYTVSLTVKTSLGDKNGGDCVKSFTVSPPPKTPVAVCTGLTRTAVTRTDSTFTGTSNASGGATVSSYVFTVKNSAGAVVKTVTVTSTASSATTGTVTLEPGTYTASLVVKTSLGDRTDAKCATQFTVARPDQVEVCNPATGEPMIVDKGKEGNYKPVGDIACKPVEVCDQTTGKTKTVNPKEAGKYKPVGDAACQPKVEGTTTELPSTGPADLIAGGLGLTSLTAAGYYWQDSRRKLANALRR